MLAHVSVGSFRCRIQMSGLFAIYVCRLPHLDAVNKRPQGCGSRSGSPFAQASRPPTIPGVHSAFTACSIDLADAAGTIAA
jgi:hypothetical protein